MTDNRSPIDDPTELINSLYVWREESLNQITMVRGYIELLLLSETQKTVSFTPEQQRKFLEVAHSSAHNSAEWWNIAVDSIKYRYEIDLPEPQSISLYHMLDTVKTNLEHNPFVAELIITVPEKLPEIKATFALAQAIEYLVLPKPEKAFLTDPYYQLEKPFLPRIAVSENTEKTITINIWSDLRINIDKNIINNQLQFYPGSSLSLAKLIVEQLGNFRMRQLDSGVEFELTVALWESPD